MKCPKCSTENKSDAKFCGECGNKLELECVQCGSKNIPGNKNIPNLNSDRIPLDSLLSLLKI